MTIDTKILQVHVPERKLSKSFVFKIKCQLTSSTTHEVMISKEIKVRSYKDICGGEPKKVNVGFNSDANFQVKNNLLVHIPRKEGTEDYMLGVYSNLAFDWEIFSKFFSLHNIEPNCLNCNYTWGWYDEELGGWTGCLGKV